MSTKKHTPEEIEAIEKHTKILTKALKEANHMLKELSRQIYQNKDVALNELIETNDKLLSK